MASMEKKAALARTVLGALGPVIARDRPGEGARPRRRAASPRSSRESERRELALAMLEDVVRALTAVAGDRHRRGGQPGR